VNEEWNKSSLVKYISYPWSLKMAKFKDWAFIVAVKRWGWGHGLEAAIFFCQDNPGAVCSHNPPSVCHPPVEVPDRCAPCGQYWKHCM